MDVKKNYESTPVASLPAIGPLDTNFRTPRRPVLR